MAAGIELPGNGETIDLQQQVARLQALLEASRQVHSTIREEEVLEQVLRIVVRELEMAGAAFPGAGLAYGDEPVRMAALPAYPLEDRDGQPHGRAGGGAPGGPRADALRGRLYRGAGACRPPWRWKTPAITSATWSLPACSRIWTRPAQIQRSLLPQKLPAIPGYSLAFRSDTCYEVGGDYLDIVEQPDGSVLMAVADVAGKGLASAIMSTSFRSAFRAMAASGPAAGRAGHAHEPAPLGRGRRGAAALCDGHLPAPLSRDGRDLEVVNAGHNPGFLVQPGAAPHLFDAAGTPLGLLPGMRYSSEKCGFTPGTRLLFYTDGLTEVFRGDEEFGSERLLDEFSQVPGAEGRWYSRCIVGGHRGVL